MSPVVRIIIIIITIIIIIIAVCLSYHNTETAFVKIKNDINLAHRSSTRLEWN